MGATPELRGGIPQANLQISHSFFSMATGHCQVPASASSTFSIKIRTAFRTIIPVIPTTFGGMIGERRQAWQT